MPQKAMPQKVYAKYRLFNWVGSAGPRPIFRLLDQSCSDWISFDVSMNLLPFAGIANPVVEGLALPERLSCEAEQQVRFARRCAFDFLSDLGKRGLLLEQEMNVIGHQDIGLQTKQFAPMQFTQA